MNRHGIERRRFLQRLAAGMAAAIPGLGSAGATPHRIRAAAIQMSPKLGDVDANLAQAEQLIAEAIQRGAQWIILP
ncbi:MAG: nitrilase-related carbon-nitrogen hydrolase, partial [Trueperaceae bacterium]